MADGAVVSFKGDTTPLGNSFCRKIWERHAYTVRTPQKYGSENEVILREGSLRP